MRSGIVVHAFADNRRLIVTWLRRGHTCVLSGVDVPLDALTALAAWRSHGERPILIALVADQRQVGLAEGSFAVIAWCQNG